MLNRSAATIESVGAAAGPYLVEGSVNLTQSSVGYRNYGEKYIPGSS
jgi:hypothetical protein